MEDVKNMIKIALDTSCLNVKKQNSIINELEDLEKQGKIILITSTVNEKEENTSNKNDFWRVKYKKK